MRAQFIPYSIASLALVALIYLIWPPVLWILVLVVPAMLLGLIDMFQSQHSIRRNFPLIGRGRWLMEMIRPYIRQYLMESETDGAPVNRMFRSVVYQRAKGDLDTIPLGTKFDTYRIGYEWISHSMAAFHVKDEHPDPRIIIGGPDCKKTYSASVFNISAMSFGALSNQAIRALNGGAKKGGFYHNTGEGGVSPYHLENGGDLVWQIGTGYFGCRTSEGSFCDSTFKKTASLEAVKMIEIKLSQGAKPGHGGILPAIKNTPEIAAIRHVEPHTIVDSPPGHSAFSNPLEMMAFVKQLRDLSGEKPIGFKFCLGRPGEFIALCKAMVETGIKPDFITVDGAEGGTGAAPLEFSNSVGMPLRDGLAFVCDSLTGFGLKKDIKVIASGKMFTAFHLVKNLSLGADICNSARGMMLALGCVQSLICNTNECPTGIATQKKGLAKGLVVADKAERVARFHAGTVKNVMEIISAAGLSSTGQLNRTHIFRRVSQSLIQRYDEIYPYTNPGSLLNAPYPERFDLQMREATSKSFMPESCIGCYDEGIQAVDNTETR